MSSVVYLASWPRSGNTLLRAILWQCFGLESCSMNKEDSMFIRNPEWHKLTGAIRFPHKMKDVQEIIDRLEAGRIDPPITGTDAVPTVRLVHAMYRSEEINKPVMLDENPLSERLGKGTKNESEQQLTM